MELSREEEMQAYTDALASLAIAIAWQVDPLRFVADLKALANQKAQCNTGPSAGLIDAMVGAIERAFLEGKTKH